MLLWRDCCGSVVEYADGTSGLCLAAKKMGRGKVTVEDADDGADIAAYVCGKKAHRKFVRTWVTPYIMTEISMDDAMEDFLMYSPPSAPVVDQQAADTADAADAADMMNMDLEDLFNT